MKVPRKNWLEWTVFTVGFAIVAATMGYLAWDMVRHDPAPPSLTITMDPAFGEGDHYVVPVKISNSGDMTAENVLVRVTLTRGGEEVESGEFSVDFVPRHSDRKGRITFRNDPSDGNLTARPAGYEIP